MYNDIHGDFILSPLFDILKGGVNASYSLTAGIETYPLSEYFFQSLSLRMTGAQEQKLKCILWELASNDYQFRYDFLHTKSYGECSEYKAKSDVFNDLVNAIKSTDSTFTINRLWDDVPLASEVEAAERTRWEANVRNSYRKQADEIIRHKEETGGSMTEAQKRAIHNRFAAKPLPETDFANHLSSLRRKKRIHEVIQNIIDLFECSKVKSWAELDFIHYKTKAKQYFDSQRVTQKQLLDGELISYHRESVYKHRNACAHNTVSYQKNLPTLNALRANDYKKRNYFFRFTLLILIDEVFVRTYQYYNKRLQE